ncbi:MAG: hypothetical protein P8P28_05135 [Polaribacter sp.]|nr:hypothetical protein [Polaribacter sp.]MDG1321392.1 hypothetical protein [Polaribacter sp.]
MNTFLVVLKIVFGIFFLYAGIMHFIKPQFFKHFIPDFLPKLVLNYLFGAIEIILGIALFFSQTVNKAAAGIFILMLLFLPIHIWDLTKERPSIGSKKLAIIRIPLQFLLLYLSYLIYTHS